MKIAYCRDMEPRTHRRFLILGILITIFHRNNGCQLDGISTAPIPIILTILDTHTGSVINTTTSDIVEITGVEHGNLNHGPYLEVSHSDSRFLLWTNDLYAQYEEHEILQMITITVHFRCTEGGTLTRVFWVNVEDTNNNAPVFIPTDQLEFTIATPVPPGFEVTGCLDDITVRDIDLTTQRIDFSIEENPYFEIMYDPSLSTTPKEFKAILRTTTFIRTLTEPMTLRISATDVDLTNDPPLTTYATVRILSNTDFELPPEPVFSQTFYLANYTESNTLVHEPIYLQQGFDDAVEFTLEGEYKDHFQLVTNGPQISLSVVTPLPDNVILENQIFLIVRAERNYTSGGSSTIIIRLPDVIPLEFERAHYTGVIVDNTLQLQELRLSQGYEGRVTVSITSDHSTNFNATIQGNVITITMSPLNENVILANNFINLQVIASTDRSSASAIVTLEIIKDDVFTPAFDRALYTGTYDPTTNLIMEPITIVNGFDDTVVLNLEGDYRAFFEIVQVGPNINLRATALPPEIYSEQHILLTIRASKPRTVDASAAIVISLPEATILDFEEVTYRGTLRNNILTLETIVLSDGYDANVNFSISGEYASYFAVSNVQNQVLLNLATPLPESVIAQNNFIVLTLEANAQNAITASATVLLEIIKEDITTPLFSRNIYYATYSGANSIDIENINLRQGYDDSVTFRIEGEHSQYFGIRNTENNVALFLASLIPPDVIFREKVLSINILANKELTVGANAAVLIRFPAEFTEPVQMRFSQNTYTGTIENDRLSVDNITLSVGYESGTEFILTGDYAEYFHISIDNNNVISVSLSNPLPTAIINDNNFLILEIEARRDRAVPVSSSIVIDVMKQIIEAPVFSEAFYRGTYAESTGLLFQDAISLSSGYDETVTFSLEGEFASLFQLLRNNNSLTLSVTNPIPSQVLENNEILLFKIVADKPNTINSNAAILIEIQRETIPDQVLLRFERITYVGSIANNTATVDPIVLSEGFNTNVTFSLRGELVNFFSLTTVGPTVSIALISAIPEASIPANGIIVLELQASAPNAVTAHTTVVFTVVTENENTPTVELVFGETHYTGSYTDLGGLVFNTPISLSQGYDASVQFALEGADSQWFALSGTQNSVIVTLTSAIPASVVANNRHLIFSVTAQRPGSATARTTVIILLNPDTEIELSASFDKILYEGVIQNSNVIHENIIVSNFNGTSVDLYGEYAEMFRSRVSDGAVLVQAAAWAGAPAISHVALELRADDARAVLVLSVLPSDVQIDPEVTFSSPTYSLSVDNARTGLIGRVVATADNGEPVRYTITSSDHLMARLSINENGELFLSAPAEIGNYTALVTATTILTQTRAQAMIYLSVREALSSSEGNLPPLIIIDRDEEVPHRNLIVLNHTQHPGCMYSLANRWPVNQAWLYVDEEGLHTRAIDREHESIALMALSQVQVELTLHCGEENVRNKRSLNARPDWLGPYDYGTKEWVLTNSIPYNPRRTVVNLIVNDINDNHPIFIGKEHEPIAVGYPVDELVERIMPRSLAELQATDADVGINAALVYWSTEEAISVARTTGFIHVRDGASIEDNTRLVIHATDRNGEGLSGSIEIMVKLLNIENIVVVTIRDAFLDDERNILTNLSSIIGYDVKVLRSTVIPDGAQPNQGDSSRKRRSAQATGSSLQLYIYGMIEREPVTVNRLTSDINNNAIVAVTVASVVSLQDYLEGREICVIPGRDTGLLVATILLSILLFILIVLIAAWFIIKRRKNTNYEQFSDQISIASRNESLGAQPKPVNPPKPRLNVDELKKSERRLQDMLQAPVVDVKPTTSKKEPQQESILDIPPPDSPAPTVTVIQSIDKLKDATDESDTDEFGEVDTTRRKSVVTFNENVEKIIHVEDSADEGSHPGYEIYKL